MPKRKRLYTPKKYWKNGTSPTKNETPTKIGTGTEDKQVRSARGRLMGALLEALEADSDEDRYASDQRGSTSDEEEGYHMRSHRHRQSYVLKLFDRSVDLSQFQEDSPLYPICRAWITNRPKVIYKDFYRRRSPPPPGEGSVPLPGPRGAPVPRAPPLLPEQAASAKENINLKYGPSLPSRESLLSAHLARWAGVRGAWRRQAARVEARYAATQEVLNNIHVNGS